MLQSQQYEHGNGPDSFLQANAVSFQGCCASSLKLHYVLDQPRHRSGRRKIYSLKLRRQLPEYRRIACCGWNVKTITLPYSGNLNTAARNITSTLAQFCMMVQDGSPLSLNPGNRNKYCL